MLWYLEDELILDQRKRQLYCALIQTPTQIWQLKKKKEILKKDAS